MRGLKVWKISALFFYFCTCAQATEITFEQRLDVIHRGISYLVNHQSMNGSWEEQWTTPMTAMAGLALLSAGNVSGEGPYGANVERCILFLLKAQNTSGVISIEAQHQMYGHGYSTLLLSQALGMSHADERIRKALHAAVDVIVKSQSPHGGWYYDPFSTSDEGSTTIVQVQALRAARDVGIQVPYSTIQASIDYIQKSQNSDGSVGYQIGGGAPSLALTAQGMGVLFNAGEYSMNDSQKKGFEYLDSNFESLFGNGNPHYFYGLFYAAQAYWHREGDEARHRKARIDEELLKIMNTDPSGDVYWQDRNYGTTYPTALSVMILAMELEILPIFQK